MALRSAVSKAPICVVVKPATWALVSAWACVRWLLRFVSTHSFVGFAYYRIAFGVVVLATAWSGLVTWAP